MVRVKRNKEIKTDYSYSQKERFTMPPQHERLSPSNGSDKAKSLGGSSQGNKK